MKDIKKPANEQNIKAIMFDRSGHIIKGNFSIADIIDLMEQKNDYKTIASFEASKVTVQDNPRTAFNNSCVSRPLYTEDLKQYLSTEKNTELPSVILLLPRHIQ